MAFSIGVDPQRRLIRVIRSGFPDLLEVQRYEREMSAEVARMQATGEFFDVLLDSSDGGVLAQEVLETLGRVSKALVKGGVRRVAMVSSSAIKTMQTKRVAANASGLRTFSNIAEAEAWLSKPG